MTRLFFWHRILASAQLKCHPDLALGNRLTKQDYGDFADYGLRSRLTCRCDFADVSDCPLAQRSMPSGDSAEHETPAQPVLIESALALAGAVEPFNDLALQIHDLSGWVRS